MKARMFLMCIGFVVAMAMTTSSFAGTQDFRLVNNTGVEVYRLFVSETHNNNWEEDVLGENVLPDGGSIFIQFSGRQACYWDMLVTDEQDGSVTFNGLNLCQSSVVVLRCNDSECWAEYE